MADETRSVLIVDDSIAIARQLQKILEKSGDFEVAGHAKNGLEAIKMYKTESPDLVLMDLVMPEMDGLQAIRGIVGQDSDARIVVVSSAGGVGEKVTEALRFGAKNVISKPFEADKVVQVLRDVAEGEED